MDNVHKFFLEKKPWSKYKDLILDYYLKPYLSKVATLKQPIVVVDCFAGPGRFGDGELGSPLIISKNLLPLYERGVEVLGLYIESNKELYQKLQTNIKEFNVPTETRHGSFKDHISEIANLAKNHTVFVYLDPLKPTDLLFQDLKLVYDQLQVGQSVETLINFMSTNFLRGILGSQGHAIVDDVIQVNHPQVLQWDQIAGGKYWQEILMDQSLPFGGQVEKTAEGYASQLHNWFKWVLYYPIREKYEHKLPKYHLIFGSRSHHAIDLMNRAMVNARREFVGARFINGMLFENQPEKEVINIEDIKRLVIKTSNEIGKQRWDILRAYATINNPCMYTDSEINQAIKQLIKEMKLRSDCAGSKIQNDALTWLP